MTANCPICLGVASGTAIRVRSGKQMTLYQCPTCKFDFFNVDPTELLAANKLDESRLQSAGLDIPTLERDFANGIRQSLPYIGEYVDASDRGRNVLEMGCSWGYFLQLLQQNGVRPHGVELNAIRARYVNDQLAIPCFASLEECEARKITFKKIFLFYVLEYIPDPPAYLKRLMQLLDDDGQIVLVTPNLADPLKDIWSNQAFRKFFYDECAVNYFTPNALRALVAGLAAHESRVTTKQGYSVVNHLSWFLTNGPRTTGMVGGDYYVADIARTLRAGQAALGCVLADKIEEFDTQYRKLIEREDCGNQIHCVISR